MKKGRNTEDIRAFLNGSDGFRGQMNSDKRRREPSRFSKQAQGSIQDEDTPMIKDQIIS